MPFAHRFRLRQDEARLVREGRHQMDAWNLLPMNAPQGLAVNGERLIGRQPLWGKPLAQDALKGGVIQAA